MKTTLHPYLNDTDFNICERLWKYVGVRTITGSSSTMDVFAISKRYFTPVIQSNYIMYSKIIIIGEQKHVVYNNRIHCTLLTSANKDKRSLSFILLYVLSISLRSTLFTDIWGGGQWSNVMGYLLDFIILLTNIQRYHVTEFYNSVV